MPAPYSRDLRQLVVDAIDAGMTRNKVAEIFSVGTATVGRWVALKRDSGKLDPKPQPLSPARRALDLEGDARLRSLVADKTDATEEELTDYLREEGFETSRSSVNRALHRLGLTLKKTVVATERDSERVKDLRKKFLDHQPSLDPGRMFFIDETGCTVSMVRDRGRAPRGERVPDSAPCNFGDVVTIIGALTIDGLTAMMTLRGGTSKDVFLTYVQGVLAPELEPGDIVVLDNLAAHKDPRVKTEIEAKGAKLFFLPPYSPDLNPIELAWSWMKRWLKTARARSEDAINNAIALAMELVDDTMAANWIHHC